MIKARMRSAGKDVILLGLSFQNLDRLREGQAMIVPGDELDLDVDIVIHANTNEDAIMQELKTAGLLL